MINMKLMTNDMSVYAKILKYNKYKVLLYLVFAQ